MTSGIYKICNVTNGKCYYGSSFDVDKRFRRHKNDLNKKKHINILLQRAWDKYQESSFDFSLVEECSKDVLLEREQHYLDTTVGGYNIGLHSSGGDNISNHPNKVNIINTIRESVLHRNNKLTITERCELYGRKGSENGNWNGGSSKKLCSCGVIITPINETCEKCRDKSGENNPFYGKTHTEESKQKIRDKKVGIKPVNTKDVFVDGVVYRGLNDAYESTGVKPTTIWYRVKSKNDKYSEYYYV